MSARSWTQQWRIKIFTSMPALRVVQIHLLWSVQGQTFPDNIKKLITHNLIISTPALTRTSHKAFSLWWQRSAARRRLGRDLSSTVEYLEINWSGGLEAARSHLSCTSKSVFSTCLSNIHLPFCLIRSRASSTSFSASSLIERMWSSRVPSARSSLKHVSTS